MFFADFCGHPRRGWIAHGGLANMFERLQKKWKVTGLQLALILCTFAIGGSLTGFTGKKIMNLLSVQQDWLWAIVYILLITVIWPLAVLLISIPFGQFPFFIKYIRKIGAKMGIGNSREPALKSRIAIFASGAGSNTQKIIDHFRNHTSIRVSLIVCNNPGAAVLQIAANENIPALLINKKTFLNDDIYIKELEDERIDLIVLAGFLWKVPAALIKAFPEKIINIHPALLPKYGGTGMYGDAVHRAVIAAGEKESGITIHYVDELYDHGKIIFQAKCPVLPADTAQSLAQRIHQLEHEHYSTVIESLLK